VSEGTSTISAALPQHTLHRKENVSLLIYTLRLSRKDLFSVFRDVGFISRLI